MKKSIFLFFAAILCSVSAWANGGIGYKGVKFTKDGTTTGWYNIHNVTWDYANSSYECRSGKSGVIDFNNADLGIVTSLKLHSFVVIGWTDNSDWVSGQLKYRTYLQSASAGNYNVYNVGNYETYCNAVDVLATSGNNRVVGKNGTMDVTLVDNNTTPGKYYLQLQGMGRMRWCNGDFNANNGSEVKASYTVPGFTTTSTSQTFDNTTVNSNSSKTISFGTHYGDALATNNCALSGTNKSEFSVTSIDESGVTVQFKPTSAGSKTATLTITDAHSKECTITLSGTAIATYTVTITNDGNGSTVPSGEQLNITEKDGIAISAEAAENFAFTSWTIVSGTGTFDTQNSVSTKFYPTSDATIQATFHSTITNSLSVVAGAKIESVAGSTDPIVLGESYAITATPAHGYKFNLWTAEPAENAAFDNASSATTQVKVQNGSVTVTASATEILSILTTANSYDAGNPVIAAPTPSATEIGIATTATVTATPATGYTLASWTLENCVRTDGGAENATTITIKSNGDGAAATVTANYEEDLTTSWVLRGSFVDDFATAYDFTKKSGESTGKVAYTTVELLANTAYRFKVVNGSNWYGNNNSDEEWWIKQTVENWDFYNDAGNCHMKTGLAGTYTFKIDYSGSNPKVSVIYPKVATVTLVDAGDLGATLTGAGEYTESSSVTVTASHTDPDWVFAYWKHQGGEIASYDAEYTFTLGAEDVVLEAYFAMGGIESNMNDLVIDTDADTYMAVLTGSDPSNGIEAMLAVSENIAGDLYRLAAAEVSFGGSSLDFVSGTVTIDMDAYTAIADVIVSLGGELMAIRMNMSATAAAPVDVMVADATVTYSDNDGALRFNGTDAYSSDAVYVELSGFEYNGVGSNTLSVAQISMFENSTAFAFADEVVVTVESDGTVSVEGTYNSLGDGSIYNVFIFGALPTYNLTLASNVDDATLTGAGTYYPTQEVTVTATEELTGWLFENWTNEEDEVVSTDATYTFRIGYDLELVANYTATTTPTTPDYTRIVTPGYFGTICLPYGSEDMTGATFFETSHYEDGKVYLNEVKTLVAGHAYIFLASATEIAVVSDGTEAVTPVVVNGLHGTFSYINDVAAESAADEYIIVYNNTTAQCELSKCLIGCWLEANRAYVVISEIGTTPIQPMPGCRRIGMAVEGENAETGFENIVLPEGQTLKAIVNGQLIIIRDGEMYNAMGVRL